MSRTGNDMIKGALHIHSDVSKDSRLSRSEIKDIFKSRGYGFVLLTEHAEDLDEKKYDALKEEYARLSDENFLMIPGLEIKWKDKVHFLAYGARNFMQNEKTMFLVDTIKDIRDKTKCELLVWGHFQHPARITRELLDGVPFVDGIEVFNAMYHGIRSPDFKGLCVINDLRKTGRVTLAFGGLDMHSPDDYNAMSCIIKGSDRITRENIFHSLKTGDFLISSGSFNLRQSKFSSLALIFSFLGSVFNEYYRKVRRGIKNILNRRI